MWLVRGRYVVGTLSVCGQYAVSRWSVCGWYVVGMWSVWGWYVVGMWLVRGRYVVGMWLVCGRYMLRKRDSPPSYVICYPPSCLPESLAKRHSQLEPSSQLRWSWVLFGHPLGLSWLEFDQAQIFAQLEPGFPPFRHLKPNLSTPKLFCYCYVTTRWYSDNRMVSRNHRCKFWFCNLPRVGSSWEHRLARASRQQEVG